MSFAGHVHNGVVVFDSPAPLAEGTEVRVVPTHAGETPLKRSLLERLGDVVGQVDGLPPDASRNVDHYLYGHPKK